MCNFWAVNVNLVQIITYFLGANLSFSASEPHHNPSAPKYRSDKYYNLSVGSVKIIKCHSNQGIHLEFTHIYFLHNQATIQTLQTPTINLDKNVDRRTNIFHSTFWVLPTGSKITNYKSISCEAFKYNLGIISASLGSDLRHGVSVMQPTSNGNIMNTIHKYFALYVFF